MTSFALPVWTPRLERLDRGRALLRDLRRAPFTWSLVAVLLVTTVVLRQLMAAQSNQVMVWASTNIQNLTHSPVRAFVASALILPDELWLPYAVLILISLGVLERRLGTLRAAGVFLSGHIIATILTEGAVWYWYGVHQGGLPEAVRDQLDVGVSYGLAASIGAALFFAPRRLRGLGSIALIGLALTALATGPGMTSSGHVLAAAIGFACWPVLARTARVATAADLAAPDPLAP